MFLSLQLFTFRSLLFSIVAEKKLVLVAFAKKMRFSAQCRHRTTTNSDSFLERNELNKDTKFEFSTSVDRAQTFVCRF